VDPKTGLKVPKELQANLRWRKTLLERAKADSGFQRELYTAASKSLLFWVNAFAWTYRLFVTMPDGTRMQCPSSKAHLPYITWAIQDGHISEIERAIDTGFDLMTDKSRDMGATWDHVVAFYHKWLFETDRSFLMISRKESCVDSPGRKSIGNPADPGTLFGKVDYLTIWLPRWMRPPYNRVTLHLVNHSNRSRIDGESANADAGSSDRRTAILLDEMAKMEEGEAIKRSTRDVTACRLANSTPNGPGTAFSNWRMSGSEIKIFDMPWWDHPEKGIGRHIVVDEATKTEKVRAPWYDLESTIRSPKEMAIDVDRDHIGSGENFFESNVLARYKATFVRPPVVSGIHVSFKNSISVKDMVTAIGRNLLADVEIRRLKQGPLSMWQKLVDGRPDQTLDYVFGIDIGKGMGASNSVVSVGCVQTRMKIAEWASANYAPHDFAYIVAALALWFGGAQRGQRPLIIYESNGDPGIFFGRTLIRDLRYPKCYLDRPTADCITQGKPKRYGWHSSTEKKAELLGDYRRALAHASFVNPSALAIQEAEMYVYFSGGAIGPACLREESASARKTHGDRVIADALCNKGLGNSRIRVTKPTELPPNSFGGRYETWLKRKKRRGLRRTWDNRNFTG